jgi:hypothetical protein
MQPMGGKNLTNKLPFPQANCLQILVESPSVLSLQIFATGPTFLTFNQTHYADTFLSLHHPWVKSLVNIRTHE